MTKISTELSSLTVAPEAAEGGDTYMSDFVIVGDTVYFLNST